jgi:small-conductance mechanosensitive channel
MAEWQGSTMSIAIFIIGSLIVWLLFHSISKHLFRDKHRVYNSKFQLYLYWGIHILVLVLFLAFYSAINSGYQDIANYINLAIDDDIQFISFIFMLMYLYSGVRYG